MRCSWQSWWRWKSPEVGALGYWRGVMRAGNPLGRIPGFFLFLWLALACGCGWIRVLLGLFWCWGGGKVQVQINIPRAFASGYIDDMKRRGRGAMRPIQSLWALALMLCSGAALALGLGDIRVLSKAGQPLVAEIPVISNEPGELEKARVALASPETFARVGLVRPQALVDELQFQFAQDARGGAVIRVTSRGPVQQKAISFLVEVDWGQGRLVREYSALVDAPGTAAAVAEPEIAAPHASAGNSIVRNSASASALSNEPRATATVPASATAVPLRPGAVLARVRQGQTLSHIALDLARRNGHSLDQTMLALLRTNPDAFIGGNINRLKQGVVLRTPQQDELAQIGAAEASAMVREQAAQWRQARAPVPQPAEAGASSRRAETAERSAKGARLEIAPAVASAAKNAGTTSGTSTDGEGDMATNEQLQQAREDIATRDAEIQELRTQVAELETLKQKQQALIALKDTDLAAAQQRLAQGPDAGSAAAFPLWLIGGLVLIVAGVVAWLAARRRKPSPLPPLPRRDIEPSLSASAPLAGAQEAHDEADKRQDLPSFGEREISREVEFEQADLREEERSLPVVEPELPTPLAAAPVVPAAHEEDLAAVAPVEAPAQAQEAWVVSEPGYAGSAGRDRLELAVAYLDLGDAENARSLLLEVAAGGDPDTRAEAARILSQIGA